MKNKFGKWNGLAALITVGLVLSGASAFAADNGNVVLSGTVAAVNWITVVGSGTYNTLNLAASAAAVKVADVTPRA